MEKTTNIGGVMMSGVSRHPLVKTTTDKSIQSVSVY